MSFWKTFREVMGKKEIVKQTILPPEPPYVIGEVYKSPFMKSVTYTQHPSIITDPSKYTENPGKEKVFAFFNPKDQSWCYLMGYHYVGIGVNVPWTIITNKTTWDKLLLSIK